MGQINLDNSSGGRSGAVALAADLLFAGRIRGTAERVGADLVLARSPAAVIDAVRSGAALVLLDLDTRGVDAPALIRTIRSDPQTAGVRIVAFVSHVRADAIDAARNAGADRVLARSAFVRDLPALLAPE